jgi:crotonobetainyl-CoA:carnitine CoA-transferase CaiB-like acyl-CoA transferase
LGRIPDIPANIVLVKGFRSGVMDRLGLGDDARSRNSPLLVCLSISGLG